MELLPAELKERVRSHIQGLIAEGMAELEAGRVVDGPRALEKMRADLAARHEG